MNTNEVRPRPTPRQVFDQIQRRVLAYDGYGFAELFAPEAVIELPFAAAGLPARLEGREQIRQHIAPRMEKARAAGRRLTGYHALVVHETADPEVIIVEFELRGEVAMTGQSYSLPYIQVFKIRDGAILSMRDYLPSDRLAEVLKLTAS